MAAGGHFGWAKIKLIAFLAISDQYSTFFLDFFFTKWPPAAILDDRQICFTTSRVMSDDKDMNAEW